MINESGKFSIRKLPTDAQLSAITAIVVKDFDGDGKKDLLLAGNKFDVEVETTPADASPGLFMKGLGNFEFKGMKPFESGFFVTYNVKDVHAIRTNDTWSIVVGINNDKLRIFTTNTDKKRPAGLALAR